jgi:branched-chain amino acid transport system ATP-binding protein
MTTLLKVNNVSSGYGNKPVIFNISLEIKCSEIVALIGPNGSGKSTILKSICGWIPIWNGAVEYEGKSIKGNSLGINIRNGITYSPQGNRVFPDLTVKENMDISGLIMPKKSYLKKYSMVMDFFPILKSRLKDKAGILSGGEKQILSLARAIIPETKILLIDEPSHGLAPNLVRNVMANLSLIGASLNISILIVEQKVKEVLSISNRVYGLKLGRIYYEGSSRDLLRDYQKIREIFL